MPWVKAEEAREFYSISAPTLRTWSKTNKIRSQQLKSGRYQYWIDNASNNKNKNTTIIYARVSSSKQVGDLRRQEQYLKSKYPSAELKSDIGSGLNYRRTGFRAILQSLFERNIKEVVVAHKDRFTRIDFEFFEWLFNQFGAVIKSLDSEEFAEGTNNEFTDDLMSIITVFTTRYYGRRKYKKAKSIQKRNNKGTKTSTN
jgi:predicted site-specific integrase-resolvase